MRAFALTVALLTLLCSCSTPVDIVGGRALPVGESLRCETKAQGLVVPVEIDGRTFHLLVDTGANLTVLRRDVVRKVWRNRREVEARTTSTSAVIRKMGVLPVSNVRWGHERIEKPFVCVLDIPHLGNVGGRSIDGLLGMDVLKQRPFLFDAQRQRIHLLNRVPSTAELKRAEALELPVSFQDDRLLASVSMDGISYRLTVDTGSSDTSMNRSIWKGPVRRTPMPVMVDTVDGRQSLQRQELGVVRTLRWGHLTTHDVAVGIRNNSTGSVAEIPPVLGMDILSKGIFLFSNGQIWLLPPSPLS